MIRVFFYLSSDRGKVFDQDVLGGVPVEKQHWRRRADGKLYLILRVTHCPVEIDGLKGSTHALVTEAVSYDGLWPRYI